MIPTAYVLRAIIGYIQKDVKLRSTRLGDMFETTLYYVLPMPDGELAMT